MQTHAKYGILKHAELIFLGDLLSQLVTDIKPNTFSNPFFKYKNLFHLATFPPWIYIPKITEIKWTFHASMGTIKDRNSKNLTEAEE